ncbi:iron complex outermembrane receptor protein [Saonia flava]|uniref:Iron complex outermembrane receptor protein n=1 Tax=Saonia flava TaxID=523696 RepID=A0A846QWR7_9FLAO|nr:TonB-dependent receptor [Saonia flava]NJB71677.1 iron complex outermembrane receptor protein [Saonia flava]
MKQLLLMLLFISGFFSTLQSQEIGVSGKITDDSGEPLPGVNVVIKGTSTGTTSDFDGNYEIDAPSTGTLVFSSLGFGTKEMRIAGKTTLNVMLSTSAQALEEIVVVGSRGQARTKLETPVPVDVINIAEQSINIPQTDLSQMLATTAPSFTAFVSQGGDLSSHVAPPSLRGLAPNQMLVLINGKKRHSSALLLGNQTGTPANAVDMSLIPSAAIERVEILRDGASAQYGSDAIAGVMNIVMKKGTNKFTGALTVGGYPNSPPDLSDSDLTDDEKALDRDTGADGFNYQFDGNYGFGFENGGYLNITGMLRQAKRTIRPTVLALSRAPLYSSNYLNNELTNTDGNPIITNPELVVALANGDAAAASELTTVAGLMNARGIEQKDVATYAGLPAMNIGTLAYNFEIPLNDEVNFYSFGDVGFKFTEGFSCFYRRAAQTDRFSYELFPNGFRPQIYSNQTNLAFSAGVSGMLGEYKFDLSNTFGTNGMNFNMFNTWNASLGNASPTEMDLGKHSFTQNTANLDISRYFDNVMEGFNIAAGVEYRMENYKIEEGQAESFTAGEAGVYTATEDNELLIGPDGFPLEDLGGNPIVDDSGNPLVLPYAGISRELVKSFALNCQCFSGFSPENASDSFRTVIAAYLDAELDVTDNFFVGAAVRTENYSDFGSVFTGKVASRLSLSDNFALRGSFSTGFRAPSLQELNYSHSFTFFVNLVPFDGTLYPNSSSAARAIGVGQLTEEKSTNVSFGFTTKLFDKLDLTVDAYKIDIKDRIFQTNTFSSADAPALGPVIGSGLANFRINGGDISTKGIEVVANYNTYVGENKLGLVLSGTFRENKFEGATVPDLNTALTDEELEAKYVSRASIGQFETGTPNSKIIGTVTYDFGKFSALLRGTRYGSVTDLDNNQADLQDGTFGYPDQTYTPEFTTDIGLTYKFSPSLSLTVGGNNIFNEYPEIQRYEQRTFYLYSTYQQGSSGAYYFGRLTFSL